MKLYTIQIAQWRKAKTLGIPVLDTTVKSGDKCFAPVWEMVSQFKSGVLTEAQYRTLYHEQMMKSIKTNPGRWGEVLRMDVVAIGCYCSAGKFCHRHLLAEILNRLCLHNGVDFALLGEID